MREGWESYVFSDVFDLQMGKTPDRKSPELFEGDNVWVTISDLSGECVSNSKEHISDEAASKIKMVKEGTVIMSFKLSVGKAAIASRDLYTNEAIMAFNVNEGYKLNNKFLYYYLSGYNWEGGNRAVMGVTLNKATISKQFISIPPLPTQQSIVSELDSLSQIIADCKETLKDYDALEQSIFYDMFGDPVKNDKGWEVKKLGEIADGKLTYGSGASAIDYNGNIRYIRITDIQEDGSLNEDIKSPSEYDEKYLLNEGDLLFARSGATVGKTYLHIPKDYKCLYAGYLIRFVPNKNKVLPIYMFHYTKSNYYKAFVETAQNAVAQPNINAKQYGDLSVCVPPLPLQQQFASRIEAIEQMKSETKKALQETETLFQARMDYWFNG